ncbi:transcriptional regulator, GntR family [Saccharopolyspora kobensis]|uniref:Transcriptional regulator, GntR family n=1 Tax=Saccharopolyspora kobensis TaxID=146035 RepID=A0A1H6BQN3_9PSEU|nr:FadR/GntR family transcriptional regulator [Saccharopolyspora kobensis]SEG62942.1 transcriptional regulator, GntR family [Saccharopolyspora kobensis]SFC12394.1 transcriptional regulator, GntR family [Saccharopolyspora kobensis]
MRVVGRRSSVDEVIAALSEQLAQGAWAPGERIPTEQDLVAELGVSRAVVREAVRALVQLGCLEARQGAGTFVVSAADPTPMLRQLRLAALRDVFEVQLAYDVQAARLAALRREDADVARLRELLDRRDRAASPEEFGAADVEFHSAVVDAARNPLLTEMYRYLRERLRESLVALRADSALSEGGPEAHRALFDAISGRDPEAAARAAQAVIEPCLTSLRGVVDERGTAQ